MAGDSVGERPFLPGSAWLREKEEEKINKPQIHKYVHQPRHDSQTEQAQASQNVHI
jgi:hypothetical protein